MRALTIRHKTFLFIFLTMCSLLFIINKKNFNVLIILFFVLFLFILFKPNKKEIIIFIIIIFIFIILIIFVPKNYDHKYLNNLLHKNTYFYGLKNNVLNYLDTYNNNEYAGFIKLIIFNTKTNDINSFYNNLLKINVIHIFTISGMHLNILFLLLNKISKNKKWKYISKSLFLGFIIFYGYFLEYSVSFLRIFITTLLSYYFSNKLSMLLSGIINLFLFVNIGLNYGFLLSYGCVLCIYSILEFKFNKYINYLLISIICTLYSTWFQILMNNNINVLSIIYSFILSPLITVLYVWFLLTFPIKGIIYINSNIYYLLKYIISTLANINTIIYYQHINLYYIYLSYTPYIYLWNKKIKDYTATVPLIAGYDS